MILNNNVINNLNKATIFENFLLAAAVNQTSDSILITNSEGLIQYVNPAFCKSTGYEKNEVLGQHTRVLKSGVQNDDFYKNLWQTITNNQTWKGEMHNKRKNGELFWEFVTITPIQEHANGSTYFLAIKEDISIIKELEDVFDWKIARQNSSQGLAIIDLETNCFKNLNSSFAILHGYSLDELAKQPYQIIAGDLNLEEYKSMVPNESVVLETTHLKKDGKKFPVELNIVSIVNQNTKRLSISVKDISEQKKLVKENKRNYQQIIELQETTTHLATATLRERELKTKLQQTLNELEESKKIIEKQNKNILDSINYAWRIQNAIIPKSNYIQNFLPQSDYYYLPKDIVSGDFPFFYKKDEFLYYAVVDCTGHGVPGAMMAVISHLLLVDILDNHTIIKPSEVLNKLHWKVVKTLKQDDAENSSADGMDIALCRINLNTQEVLFSGAHRALFAMLSGNLETFKGDKFPIGGMQYKGKNIFTDHLIPVKSGDSIYFFSDGLQDQFGGPGKTKFGTKKIAELISANHLLSIPEVMNIFKDEFLHWKFTEKQLDDVLLIGIRF